MSSLFDSAAPITAETFLRDYWQKKPLLIRGGLPQVAGLLVPDELQALATEDHTTARLLTQTGAAGQHWHIKPSPLTRKDFKKLPDRWTLLVQAVDHWSPEIADLWRSFEFIPRWRRDDIMISYAPKGGSVGQHFDYYDVFLVQGYGERRWQLGKTCDHTTPLQADQPLRLLTDMGEIVFDEVLGVGDVLYVPPGLSHYGVAQDACLTYSFGFRMPSAADLLGRLADTALASSIATQPIADGARNLPTDTDAQLTQRELEDLRDAVRELVNDDALWQHTALSLLSEPRYPDHLSDIDPPSLADIDEALAAGAAFRLESASRLLNSEHSDTYWLNGEPLTSSTFAPSQLTHWLHHLAQGHAIASVHIAALPPADQNALKQFLSNALAQNLLMVSDD